MNRPAGRVCLSCGKKMRPLNAISGWASSDFGMDYCTLKCVRRRPLPGKQAGPVPEITGGRDRDTRASATPDTTEAS